MFKIRNKRFFGNNLFRHVQENLAYIIVSIIILVLIMPYLYAGAHSLFIKDDFMNYNVTVQQNGYLWITKAFQGMCHFYKEWEGTYSVVFLEFLLNPLQFSGGGVF